VRACLLAASLPFLQCCGLGFAAAAAPATTDAAPADQPAVAAGDSEALNTFVRRLNDLVIAAPVRLSEIQSTLQVGIMVVISPGIQQMLAQRVDRLQRAVLEVHAALLLCFVCK
jgi:hypothetical protein